MVIILVTTTTRALITKTSVEQTIELKCIGPHGNWKRGTCLNLDGCVATVDPSGCLDVGTGVHPQRGFPPRSSPFATQSPI